MTQDFQPVAGGITAPRGFVAAGIHAGLKKEKLDLALIVSEVPATAAAVYTRNRVKAAPLRVTAEHLKAGLARAIVANSGYANACTGERGYRDAREMAVVTAGAVGCEPWQVVVASTGVIGVPLPMDKVTAGIQAAAARLAVEGGRDAAAAIMTTDTRIKEIAIQLPLGGETVTIAGIAKGSGMIHPNMGTMLCFLTTDAAIEQEDLEQALRVVVDRTFNMVTVDGDTSTNDMAVILANGCAGNAPLTIEEHAAFRSGLEYVCRYLARLIARDGEGASKLITVEVYGAASEVEARQVARSVAGSNLVKSAIFGADANWGRIICAAGYSGAEIDPDKIDIYLESHAGREQMAAGGEPLPFSEAKAAAILAEEEITIILDLNRGRAAATAWGCDLTYDYVKINASYRT
ncbi:arginine biosynthesis bifunctional protein ArgJ [Moorella thermoacetica]|uniref:Arginine biosynthesis bifunctional protein ArgJ n=2 Tax=Neomoorella thermoacetica TaxID=1525 RepID=A0A1D7XEC3_NEOTH|nr:bifunctional glutamate N-acetyltransferase/amino-acid acetyltransferase ArgJ [Moorella thermoacetica]AKX95142.1 arginine biosynthesis bifunctional protein ArgJ [Moorella thermoacetica]AKX97767.1 arginine biosynthesis bifunctional protein ArgJ [Moorella thermoacetica]AOQ25263.1 Arginine biosynthesis bifunctional protein ArgJ [Moorella thermoacetica]OIQ09947.1 arginine biosynthesis bifunctional protein ArgJ [Moorella thermoacetica]OIQ56598.1 arginine biosynthesis bifunctional protein ArgJ [Mo